MLETICTPYGKAAFPAVVKCDGCGEVIESGWMPTETGRSEGGLWFSIVEHEHYCDACAEQLDDLCEFRICDRCGAVMTEGYVLGESCDHACEECFGPWMDENCPGGWREVEDDGCDGYFEELIDGEWHGTGIYWTQWY